MRRSLASRAIAFTSASVGWRNASRSVSRTQALASRKVGVGTSCNMSGSCDATTKRNAWDSLRAAPFGMSRARKRGGRFPASPWSLLELRRFNRTRRTHVVHRLFGRLRHRNYRYEGAAIAFGAEFDVTFDLGKEGMVGAHADIKAGMPGGAALTRDDVAGNHVLAAIRRDAKALACRITSVPR